MTCNRNRIARTAALLALALGLTTAALADPPAWSSAGSSARTCGRLFGVTGDSHLVTIDLSTGHAEVVGNLGQPINLVGADFSEDGTLWVIVGGDDGDRACTINTHSGHLDEGSCVALSGPELAGRGMALGPDGNTAFVLSGDTVWHVDLTTGEQTAVGPGVPGTNNLARTPNGYLYIRGNGNLFRMNSLSGTSTLLGNVTRVDGSVPDQARAAAFCPATGRLYYADVDSLIEVDPAALEARVVGTFDITPAPTGLAFEPAAGAGR